jgi:predicted nuclease with TOPRIM domain
MSKKKNGKMFNNVMSTITTEKNIQDISSSVEQKNEEIIENVLTNKIEYDDVSKASDELIKLNNEKSELTDKLAEYIEEIELLKKKNIELQDENDKHLMKIAELSFENATLQASLKNIDVDTKNNTNAFNPHQSSKIVNYQQQKNNIFINRSGLNTGDYWN